MWIAFTPSRRVVGEPGELNAGTAWWILALLSLILLFGVLGPGLVFSGT